MRRPQISLKALLWLILVVACFFGGIHFERERRRREDAAALDARKAQRAAALSRASQRMAALAVEQDLQQQQIAAEQEARERINRELLLQEQKVDQLMARFNALMDEPRQPLILPPLPSLLPFDALKSRQTEASAD